MAGSIIKCLPEPEKLAATGQERACRRVITNPDGIFTGDRTFVTISSPDVSHQMQWSRSKTELKKENRTTKQNKTLVQSGGPAS